jgi:hypothetical protein
MGKLRIKLLGRRKKICTCFSYHLEWGPSKPSYALPQSNTPRLIAMLPPLRSGNDIVMLIVV